MEHVEEVITSLTVKFPAIGRDTALALTALLAELHQQTDQIIQQSAHRLYESQWALLGISQRAYELIIACIECIREGNRNAYAVCFRASIETLCSLVWAKRVPDRFPSLVQFDGPAIGRILNIGYSKYPDLKIRYQEISGIAHPGRDAHLLRLRPVREAIQQGLVWPLTLGFETRQAIERVDELVQLTKRLCHELHEVLDSMSEVICTGRIMAALDIQSTDPSLHEGSE